MKKLLIFAVFLSACVPVSPTGSPTATLSPTGTETPVLTQIPSQTPLMALTDTPTLVLSETPTFIPTNTVTPYPTGLFYVESSDTRVFLYPTVYQAITNTIVYSGKNVTTTVDNLNSGDLVGGGENDGSFLFLITQRAITGFSNSANFRQLDCTSVYLTGYAPSSADFVVTGADGFLFVISPQEGEFVAPIDRAGVFHIFYQSSVTGDILSDPVDIQLDCGHPIGIVRWNGVDATPTLTSTPARPTKTPTPIPFAIANPSFENGWTTDGGGNQHPSGWTFYSPASGVSLPYPAKEQQGSIIPAVSGGPGEYVHKLAVQLPSDEQLGQPRSLILGGSTVYKVFGGHTPHALQLSQSLSGPPGTTIRITVYILGETVDTPDLNFGRLENDHFVASVSLGNVENKRLYVTMITRHDIKKNQRAWNKFVVVNTFPSDGQLLLTLTFQQNWPGLTDFFVDNLSATVVPE